MKHKEWKGFLVKRFLMILALVSFSEWLLNGFFDKVLFPWLSDTLQIDFFMAGMENGLTIGVLIKGGLYLAITGLCSQFSDVIGVGLRAASGQWAGSVVTERIAAQTRYLNPRQTQIYIWGMVAVTVLVILALLVPYVLAALAFSRMVAVQVRQMEEQERRQKEEYDKRKNLLLSDVAHDLKTPMTTVAGYARALLSNEEQETAEAISREKRLEYLETIYNKSMQMSGLLNLLFEYVMLDSEGFQLKKMKEDVWELLRDCAAGLYMDFEEKGMEMIADIPEEECLMEVDPIQFQRVITNLLNNALKHNAEGTRVWIMAEREDEETVIRICDDGEIIPEQTAKYIFEPFVLGDESRNSKGGSGLGLSIAHKVIAMHGGLLTLEQNKGEPYRKAFVIRFAV
ncbi:sensor histidine kinase [Lachnospiraceae bacterium]|nr:sensor histidine kinase [Lachnospiraceae bacterium]